MFTVSAYYNTYIFLGVKYLSINVICIAVTGFTKEQWTIELKRTKTFSTVWSAHHILLLLILFDLLLSTLFLNMLISNFRSICHIDANNYYSTITNNFCSIFFHSSSVVSFDHVPLTLQHFSNVLSVFLLSFSSI